MATFTEKVTPALLAFGMASQLAVPAMAQYNPYNNAYSPNAAYTPPQYQRGQVQYVPAGVTFPVTLSTSISTDVARPGDTVQAMLNQPINLGNGVIPQGSVVIGTVTEARSGGFLGRAGMLSVKFNRLRTPNGMEVPMSAHVVGDLGRYAAIANGSDTFAGETWKTKAGQAGIRTAVGAGTGAALGTAIGAIAGRHGTRGSAIGRGAWSGAAIGGGLGLTQSLLLRKGKNVVISSGTPMDLQLDAPITLSSVPTQYGAF
jgi:type IV secretory pathway VirB10-like protein